MKHFPYVHQNTETRNSTALPMADALNLLVFASMALTPLSSAAASQPDPVKAAIAQRSRVFESCFARADAECLVDNYFVADGFKPSASPPGGYPPIVGRSELISMYRSLFKQVAAIRLETIAISSSGDLAHELGRAHLSLRGGGQAIGRYTVLWRKTPLGWRAQLDFIATDGWKDQ
jgi:ketosteroid isomerase-like protein